MSKGVVQHITQNNNSLCPIKEQADIYKLRNEILEEKIKVLQMRIKLLKERLRNKQ